MPTDQRTDDAQSLSLDGAPLTEAIEIFGSVTVELEVSADQPAAFVVARLCDVAPDGRSTLVARGVLNLCHHAGHGRPQALVPGEPVRARIAMKSTAYRVPAGHRLRLALSTSYWPWLWPSPAPATITVATGADRGSRLELPVRAPQPADAALPAFGPAEQAQPLAVRWIREPAPGQTMFTDPARGLVGHVVRRDFGGAREHPNGLVYGSRDPVTLTVTEGDPLSAKVTVARDIEQRRGDWRTRIELRATMTADKTDYLLTTSIDAYEGDTRVHSTTFSSRVPRDHT